MRLLFLFVLVFHISFVAQAVDLSTFPPCDAQACESMAAVEKWPSVKMGETQQVEFHGFNVLVPKAGIITRSNYSFRQFDIDEKRWVSLSVFKRDDMDEFFKASRFNMSDWADIVFTQTPKSKMPETNAEAYAWYSTLMTKVVFVGGHMVTQYKKSPFVVYWINENHSETDVLMIVSSKLPNVMLKMEVFGFDQAAIMQLISGVSPAK